MRFAQIGTLLASLVPLATAGDGNFRFDRVSSQTVGTKPTVMSSFSDEVLVYDDERSRIVLLGPHRNLSFGELGTGPGQMYEPSAIGMNARHIVVVEPLSQRIQWFDKTGKFVTSCRIPSSLTTRTVAVLGDDTILVNDSHALQPVVHLSQTCKVLGAFGRRTALSSLYQTSNTSKDEQYHDAANRVYLAADDKFVATASLVAPVVTIYHTDSKEQITVQLGHEVDEAFWAYSPARGGLSTGIDGTQVPEVTRGLAIDPISNKLFVLGTRNLRGDGILYAVDCESGRVTSLNIRAPDRGLFYHLAYAKGNLFLSLVFGYGVYSTPLPQTWK